MEKKQEVEYRAFIAVKIFKTLLNKARKFKNFRGQLIIRDTYFCPKRAKNFRDIEMNRVGSYSLRLRQKVENGKERVTLNIKVIRKTGDHNAWLEHEVFLSSYKETKTILEAIGFKVFFELKKSRFSFKENGINVHLEDIRNFQPAIEVEIITSENKTEAAKRKLLDYLAQNHIQKKAIVKKSITNLLMHRRAFF